MYDKWINNALEYINILFQICYWNKCEVFCICKLWVRKKGETFQFIEILNKNKKNMCFILIFNL